MTESKNLYNFAGYYYNEGKSQSLSISKPQKSQKISVLSRGYATAFQAYEDINERFALSYILQNEAEN